MGKQSPPAGSTTLPGPNGGINEDGFFNLTIGLGQNFEYVNFTIWDLGANNEVGGTGDDSDVAIGTVPYQFNETLGLTNYVYYLNIKYTEANGAEPSFKEMATSGKDNNGQSKAVAYHFKGQTDFGWSVEATSYTGGVVTTDVFTGCLVPPPPK
ncbi:hypothetical protein HNV12_22060 [Methanococcoides sp. SA1]|nr:hypothetical protein [Methanococcoides sp. SA1]